MITVTTHLPEKSQAIGKHLAKYLRPGDCVPLIGDMGSGKTCFVQGVARGLDVPDNLIVNSPSFVLVNHYPGRIPLYHVDLYRLNSVSDLDDLELEEIIHGDGVTFIEWPQLVIPQLSNIDLSIKFFWDLSSETSRTLTFQSVTSRFEPFFKELSHADSWN